VALIIQNATISPIFYLLRLDEIFNNSLSPFTAFYKRHFINIGKQWHRKEEDVFQYGYFYAQILTFYCICLVFSSTVPCILLACLYFFFLKTLSDFYSLLCVHRMEIESSGYLINKILNFANFPVLFYQLSMLSFFFINQRWNDVILILCLFICSLIYVLTNIHTYIFDIYSLHNSLKAYDNNTNGISLNEINKWRNKFKHPLVLPIHLEGEEYLKSSSRKFSFEKDNIDSPIKNYKIII
jgi:hypothetical protein